MYCTDLGGQDNNIKQNGTEMCQAQENLGYAMSSLFWWVYQKGFSAKHTLFFKIIFAYNSENQNVGRWRKKTLIMSDANESKLQIGLYLYLHI